MTGKNQHTANRLHRRLFLSNTIKLALLGSILPSAACNHKSAGPPAGRDSTSNRKITRHVRKQRKKWSYEGLLVNRKTKVMHLPTAKVYRYYDEIKPAHLQAIPVAGWASQEPLRLNKEQSGNILEILSLQNLRGGVNDGTLDAAAGTLEKAFSPACDNVKGVNVNIMNFRLHELMLQFLALNASVPDKWQTFNSKVKRPETLRKRQKWMESETAFNERVNYIQARQTDYRDRLATRAGKYSFT